MSSHPNVILMAVLTPHDLSRKTRAAILAEHNVEDGDNEVEIGGTEYISIVMEDNYEDGWQIAAKEGDLVFHSFLTYGYGEPIEWSKMEAKKQILEAWAKQMSEKHQCDFKIMVTANYW